jgi:hypothetical protein
MNTLLLSKCDLKHDMSVSVTLTPEFVTVLVAFVVALPHHFQQ